MSRGQQMCEKANQSLQNLTGGRLWIGWDADHDDGLRAALLEVSGGPWELPLFLILNEDGHVLRLGYVQVCETLLDALRRAEDSAIPPLDFAIGNNVWPVLCVLRDFTLDAGVCP